MSENEKKTKEKLKKSEEKFRNLVEITSDWIWEVNTEGVYTFSSSKVKDLLGYNPEQIIGKTPFDFMPTEEASKIANKFFSLITSKKPFFNLENTNLHKNGKKVILETSGVPFFDIKGNFLGFRGIDRDITARKKSEAKLKISEAGMKSIFRAAPIGIGVVKDRVFINVNKRICELTGYSKKELINKSARIIYPSNEEFERVGKVKYSQIKKHRIGSIETKWLCKDGQIIDVLLSSSPINIKDLSEGVTFSVLDITEQKQAEKQRKAYLNFLKNINQVNKIIQKSNNVNQMLWDVLKTSLSIFKCDRIWLLYPCDPDAPTFKIETELNNQEYPGAFQLNEDIPMKPGADKVCKVALGSELPVPFGPEEKHKIYPELAKEFNVLSQLVMAIYPKIGKPWGLGMHQCSYARKWTNDEIQLFNEIGRRIEDSLSSLLLFKNMQKSEEEYRTLYENSTLGIYRTTPGGKVLMANPALLKMLGYSNLKELQKINLEKDLDERIYPRSEFKSMINQKGVIHGYETQYIKKDGSSIDINESAQVIKNSNGEVLYYEGWAEDITLRKKTEKALFESERKFRNLFNSSSDGIIIFNDKYKILAINETLINLLGFKKEYLFSKEIIEHVPPKYTDILKQRISALYNGESLTPIEIETYKASGDIISIEISSKIIDYENKKAVLTMIRDISERKETERKILTAVIETEEREKERFAKDLHDGLGPLLSAAKIYSKSFQLSENTEEKMQIIKKLEETIDDAILGVQEISNNLSPHILKNFGLTTAVESFYKKITDTSSIKFALGSNFEIRVSEKIETTLYRIIVELINNTLKHASANTIILKLVHKENNLFLHYADDGTGFNIDDTLSKNTGMGLSNIISRIKSLNGDINMSSSNNKGYSVKMRVTLY